MVDKVVSKQELIDAQKDAKTLEDVINGEVGQLIKTRLGRMVYTLASIPMINTMPRSEISSLLDQKTDKTYVDASLTAIAGGHKAYATLAAALANTSTFPQNSIVEITNDGANNGTYQWNGADLTKSAYDPLTQAKAYTDQTINSSLYDQSNEIIGTGTINTLGSYVTSTSTVSFAQAVTSPGYLSEVNLAVNRLGSLKVLVFNKVGLNLILDKSVIIDIDQLSGNFILENPIFVEVGQYIGFYNPSNFIKSLRDGGVYTATYPANGETTTIPADVSFNVVSWQINFKVSSMQVIPKILEIEQDEIILKEESQLLKSVIFGNGSAVIGPYNLVKTANIAAKTHIPLADPLNFNGKLLRVNVAHSGTGNLSFFTLSKLTENSYALKSITDAFPVPDGVSVVELNTPLDVNIGDYIGFASSTKGVCFVTGQNITPYLSGDLVGSTFTSGGAYSSGQPQIRFIFEATNVKKVLSGEVLTQAEYDALAIKDLTTLYFVVG